VFGPSVRVVLGLCTDLARTQLGHGWLVKQNIHQNLVRVQSVRIRWGAGCFLTQVVRAGWHAKLKTSVVAFDLAQFFPSINHDVLLSILDKQGFAPEVVAFFRSYLVDRFTCYAWDDDLSPEFPSSIGVGQGSALSPILSALCLAHLLKEFECRVCVAVLISYVDSR
jgi:hypothetical protein